MTSDDFIIQLKKQPIGFACGLLSLILAGFLYYRDSKIAEGQTEFDARSAEAAKIISNVTLAKNLPEQVAAIQTSTKELESRLVRAGQLAVNLQYFYKLEAETGVKLLDVHQNALLKTSSLYSPIPFNVTVQGSYKQVMIFLNHLENGRHFCRFTSVGFTKLVGGAVGTGQTNMTLAINLELLGQP